MSECHAYEGPTWEPERGSEQERRDNIERWEALHKRPGAVDPMVRPEHRPLEPREYQRPNRMKIMRIPILEKYTRYGKRSDGRMHKVHLDGGSCMYVKGANDGRVRLQFVVGPDDFLRMVKHDRSACCHHCLDVFGKSSAA